MLDNEANAPVRVGAYWLLTGYAAISVSCLYWGVRRWSQRSRAALWVLPLVLGTTTIAIVTASIVS